MVRNIILIGFMGTGKSTVGKAVATELDWGFIDTDEQVEALAGKSISELFAQDGEQHFRKLESQVLSDIAKREHLVVSTGGGAVLRQENRQAMLASGLVVALTADAETIIERVRLDTNRPLLAGDLPSKVQRLMKERAGAYDFATVKIDTSGLGVEEIVEIILTHTT